MTLLILARGDAAADVYSNLVDLGAEPTAQPPINMQQNDELVTENLFESIESRSNELHRNWGEDFSGQKRLSLLQLSCICETMPDSLFSSQATSCRVSLAVILSQFF